MNNRTKRFISIAFSFMACVLLPGCATTEITASGSHSKPDINYFVADVTSITSGTTVNLNWDVANADRVSIEPGIGIVPLTGMYKVTPSSNVEYKLTAVNGNGESIASAGIQVAPAAQSPECISAICDPVTGRNADISFKWEQLSLCTEYDLQISKDPQFTMVIYNRQQYTPYSATSPGLVYLAGGILECGHTYYVRVRCTAVATGQKVRSPWSVLGCLTVNSGLPVDGSGK